MIAISGTMLRDLLVCERRLGLDIHGDPGDRDSTSAFVKMLWRDGLAHENDILSGMAPGSRDLRMLDRQEREHETLLAIASGASIILGAVLVLDDLVGMPDILLNEDGGYVAVDVKSGGATTGANALYKTEYLVQVAHYAHILREAGLGRGDVAAIIDAAGERVDYDLLLPYGRDRLNGIERHAAALAHARRIRDRTVDTRGALAAQCGLCDWRTKCREELTQSNDLTLVCGLGRALRDGLHTVASTVPELASLERPSANGGTGIPGVGPDRLSRFIDRAALMNDPNAGPTLRAPLDLPRNAHSIDFDVELDPSRGILYLHGFWHERHGPGTGEFVHFFAETPDAAGERGAFAEAIAHFRQHRQAHWFHYSAYERTAYRALQRRHPDVCDEEEIDEIFDAARCTDIYQTILKCTDWPLSSYSIKSIAKSVGFSWEDTDPGGANSIEWFDRYARNGDSELRDRIIAYNRDDVIASARVRSALAELEDTGRIAAFQKPKR